MFFIVQGAFFRWHWCDVSGTMIQISFLRAEVRTSRVPVALARYSGIRAHCFKVLQMVYGEAAFSEKMRPAATTPASLGISTKNAPVKMLLGSALRAKFSELRRGASIDATRWISAIDELARNSARL